MILFSALHAQPGPKIALPRINGDEITIDGVVDEAAWNELDPLPLVESSPNFGNPPSEKTEIRVAYDSDYFYASARFYARDVSKISASSIERDVANFSDETFLLLLDTFNDNENALGFRVNAAGNRVDMSISGDAVQSGGGGGRGGPPWNQSWNTFWDAAATRDEQGWYAEMRIPFSSLRFQDENGQVTMGLQVGRWIASKSEYISYPPIEQKWDMGFVKPSIAQDVTLNDVFPSKPFYITPYILGGDQQTNDLNASETAYQSTHDVPKNVGVDLKYSLTSNLTLDVTLNTDFAQVEADVERVNLTRFSLFFPEKRLFFQERAAVFDFKNGASNRLFYSRRIGLSEFGPVPIIAGGRMVGRIGDWDVGVINMQTASADQTDDDDLPITVAAENFSVARIRRSVLNENSFMGGMITNRLNSEGAFNRAVGLDGNFRLWGDDYLGAAYSQATNDTLATEATVLDIGRLRLNLARRSTVGPTYSLSYSRSGELYDPGMGFESRNDFYRYATKLGYGWLGGKESNISDISPSVSASYIYRSSDGLLESVEIFPRIGGEMKSGYEFATWTRWYMEELSEDLELPNDTFVPVGRYEFYEYGARFGMPRGKLLRTGIFAKRGTFYDGTSYRLGMQPNWVISQKLSISANYTLSGGDFPDRDMSFKVHLLSAKFSVNINTKISTLTFVQLNTASDALAVNFRLRYNPREGTDFYFVYNEGINTDRTGLPRPPQSSGRTILLKYAVTFIR